jgi:signal transduction histidine kinase
VPGANTVHFEPQGPLSPVLADRAQLDLVVAELVQNALTHGQGPVEIWVRNDASEVHLTVADSGAGLPDIVKDAVIHENAYALRGNLLSGSYGFGLIAAQRALASMSGSLKYDRQNGRTLFTASLPVASGLSKVEGRRPKDSRKSALPAGTR